jgi:hypothetical protein
VRGEHSARAARGAEAGLFAALVVWALAPLAYLLIRAGDREFTGAGGVFPGDQLQYFAWIRSAGDNLLAANGYDLASGGHVLLHPMFTPSGLLTTLGASVPVAFLLWLPVAVAVLFFGYRQYCRDFFSQGWARAAALALGLFAVSPVVALVEWADLPGAEATLEVAGESASAPFLWGYLPAAMAIGLMCVFFAGVPRALAGTASRRWIAATAASGALVSWLHPWQGEVLLLATAGLVLWMRPRRDHLRLALPVAATVLPLLYYFVLSKADSAWGRAQGMSPLEEPSVVALVVTLLPLAAFAAAGIRRPVTEPRERILVLWPLASLAVTFFFAGFVPSHGLQGITLPLAVLAVRGWQALGASSRLAVPVLIVATVPGLVFAASKTRESVNEDRAGYFLNRQHDEAMRFLDEAPGDGGVLTSPALGFSVPAFAGRRTWVGHPFWTPDYPRRAAQADRLLKAQAGPAEARQLVRRTGARWILAPCGTPPRLAADLGDLVARVRRFGCATVYEVAGAGRVERVRSWRPNTKALTHTTPHSAIISTE